LADVLRNGTRFWAVDKLFMVYVVFSSVLVLGWWNQIPNAASLFTVHLAGAALLVFEVKFPNGTSWLFHNFYPLPYVGFCYKEMALLIPAVRHTDADQWLANLDYRIWHVNPTVWLERIQSPLLTEFVQTAYTLFIPAVLLVALLIWIKRPNPEFQYYAFLITLGFLVSYVGYLIVPARGPRFLLRHLQHIPLQGLWLFKGMQSTLDSMESTAYDCFPSGHTLLTILGWWGSRFISKKVFWAYLAYTPLLIFATVYCRYHYTVDVLAGAGLGFVLILAAPAIYKKLSQGV
jgi:membrane-associated phospholipid phosphatase